ncbi:hypothetical protein ABKV19_022826 [Rosa sericea]
MSRREVLPGIYLFCYWVPAGRMEDIALRRSTWFIDLIGDPYEDTGGDNEDEQQDEHHTLVPATSSDGDNHWDLRKWRCSFWPLCF